jgi:hypothetical protein
MKEKPMQDRMSIRTRQGIDWLLQDEHKIKLRQLWVDFITSFTAHPHETGETYWQHLWFTVRLSSRFVLVSLILMTHGIFPFFFTHTTSRHIEKIYLIMKSRIPKARRDEIELDFNI